MCTFFILTIKLTFSIICLFFTKDIDRKNEQTAAILKMQGAQLAELEALYKEELVLRKRYYNIIEGFCTIFLSKAKMFLCIYIVLDMLTNMFYTIF